jgi:mannose-P-dolichol utilization defect protein 1
MLAPGASEVLARGLGWAISGASMSLYLPIAANIVRTRSAAGLSIATWALNTLGFFAALVYPLRRGFPLSSFFDTVCLTVQSVLVLALIVLYRGSRAEGVALVAGLGACGLAFAATLTLAPAWSLVMVQAAATVSMTVALLPQILKNAVRRSSGGWSRSSAALSTVGNGIRVFTTITLTGDRLLLAGFTAGLLLNGILLTQTLLWKE